MECRGTEKRQWIVDNYNVVPVAHIQLLTGQRKHSDAGATIENDYYIFHATDKVRGKRETIQCGMGAARDFLRMIGHEGLPLFNPLHGESGVYGYGEKNNGDHGERRMVEIWNPIAKQLFNAIMWIILIIDAEPDIPIFEIKEKVYRFKDREPFASQVKAVNTIISKTFGGRTLTEAIGELRANNNVRDNMCKFDRLIKIIKNYKDKTGNCVEIESKF